MDDARTPTAQPQAAPNDAEARAAAQKFPETTKQVLEFYKTKASGEERKPIAQAIRQANRAIKQETRGDDDEEQGGKKRKRGPQPSPEEMAGALYDIFKQQDEAVVRGDPRDGYQTRIKGKFDLIEVARKLLSLG